MDELEEAMLAGPAEPQLQRRLLLFGAMIRSAELGDRALEIAAEKKEDPARILELVLQAFLFAGFPRLINSLRSYRKAFGDSAGQGPPRSQDQGDIDRWRHRGEQLFRTIYAVHADRVLSDLDAYHEDLRDWILVDAYGKILARPALPASERELAAVTALTVSGDLLQLSSHMRGALHCGAAFTDLDLALDAAAPFVPDDRLLEARSILRRIADKRV